MHQDPHQLVGGMVISCFAVNAHLAYIYIREEFPEAAKILELTDDEGEPAPAAALALPGSDAERWFAGSANLLAK